MKIIGVIPARYNSSRFPGKPLVDLKGKPMILETPNELPEYAKEIALLRQMEV